MNGTRDTNETSAADTGDEFDPQQAAALLEQTKRQARRQFDPNPPLLSLLRTLVGAAGAAAREDWRSCGTMLAVAVVAVVSAFAGPVNVWLFMGVGLSVALLVSTAATAWLARA